VGKRKEWAFSGMGDSFLLPLGVWCGVGGGGGGGEWWDGSILLPLGGGVGGDAGGGWVVVVLAGVAQGVVGCVWLCVGW